MDKVQTISRRAALIGALVSSAAIAVPVAAKVLPNPSLQAIADEFVAAHVAEHRADKAALALGRALDQAVADARIYIRHRTYGGGRLLGADYDPDMARADIREARDSRLALIAREKANGSPSVFGSVEGTLRDYELLMQHARKGFRRYYAIRRKFPVDAAWDEADALRKRRKAAVAALIDFKFQSVAELAIVAKAILQAGRESESWHGLPTNALLGALAGDDEVRGWA